MEVTAFIDSGILVVAEIFVENNAVILHKVYERMLKVAVTVCA